MIGLASNTKLREHNARNLIFLVFSFVMFAPVFVQNAPACCVTDADIWAGKTQGEANAKSNPPDTPIYICKGQTAYFYAECSAQADPKHRQLKWTYTFGDSDSTIHYTAYNDYDDTASHTYTSADAYTVTVTVERVGVPECGSKSDTCKVTVVEVDKIQYDDPDSGWTDITGTLYVMYGTSVQFKAIPNPSGASWPSGKPVWGGTSGASGTGETTLVTFYSMSSSTSDYKTITAECGNTVTENIIVYHFVGDFTPSDDFSGRSHIKYGLEETVALDFIMDPTGVSASQAGGLEWTKTGVGDISNAGNDGTADYDAEENPGNVTFRLTVKSGPSKGKYQWYSKTVVLPSGTRMTRATGNVKHTQGDASAGIALYYWLDPKNVSFKYLTFGEDSCPATGATGIYITAPPGNHAQNTFGAILGGNSTTGCRVQGMDGAWSSRNPWAPGGTYTWSIPTQYIDDTSTRNTFGSNQNHVPVLQANGDATMNKGGQSGSAALNDPTSGW